MTYGGTFLENLILLVCFLTHTSSLRLQGIVG